VWVIATNEELTIVRHTLALANFSIWVGGQHAA
jgi:hypothetical protein